MWFDLIVKAKSLASFLCSKSANVLEPTNIYFDLENNVFVTFYVVTFKGLKIFRFCIIHGFNLSSTAKCRYLKIVSIHS